MSLATTCPTCTTVFRVVEDQLKASEGWVRCGQCQQVFNALEGLFDLSAPRSRPGPLTWAPTQPVGFEHDPAPQAAPGADADTGSHGSPSSVSGGASTSAPSGGDTPALGSTSGLDSPARSSTAASREFFDPVTTYEAPADILPPGARFVDSQVPHGGSEWESPSFDWPVFDAAGTSGARAEAEAGATIEEVPQEDDSLSSRWAGLHDESPVVSTEQAVDKPAFVRDAERRERWQRPGVRLAFTSLAALLALMLGAQVALHWRDRLAASRPMLQPVLAFGCRLTGCELQPPKVIDALVVDNTTVTRPPGVEAYRLAVQLRNRADYAVAVPHLELNLTDGQGKVIVRRILAPADFRITDTSLPGQSEASWSLDFSSGQRRISSYTVAAFYP